MTTAQNPVAVQDAFQLAKPLPVTTNLAINAGDYVYWDATNYTVTPLSASSQVANNYLGVALQSTPAYIYGTNDPSSDPANPSIMVMVRGVAWAYTTAAETYNHFDDVTIGADAQTIVKAGSSSTNRVGFVLIDAPTIGNARPLQATPVPETVTGAAGVRVMVLLEPKHKAAAAV